MELKVLTSKEVVSCVESAAASPFSPMTSPDTFLQGSSNSYVLEQRLGYGSSSSVYVGRSTDGRKKVIKLMKGADSEFMDAAEREFRLLQSMSHPHIIRTIDAAADMSWIGFEYISDSENLYARVKAKGPLESRAASTVLRNLASAIEYLHNHDVCHRDVKPENILLVGTEGDLRLIDFNAAAADATLECISPVGDFLYRAPEVGDETNGYGFEVDIWGVGASLYFALTLHFNRKKLFHDKDWHAVPDTMKETVAQCLQRDPACRPTAADLLELSEKFK
jgi:serine/threonine protein kinase